MRDVTSSSVAATTCLRFGVIAAPHNGPGRHAYDMWNVESSEGFGAWQQDAVSLSNSDQAGVAAVELQPQPKRESLA